MYRLSDIQEKMRPLVGWAQDFNPAKQIDAALTESESGLTYQGAHPLVTLENIRSIMPEAWFFKYPLYNEETAYEEGAKVRTEADGAVRVWVAAAANTGSEPTEDNPDWQPYDMVSDYLRHIVDNGINTVVQTFLQQKQLNRETRTLMERRTLFNGAARLQSIIEPHGRLVGFEITPVRSLGVTAKIERIGLQMSGAVGEITMYLFHSSRFEPVREMVFNFTNERGGFQWFTPEEPLYLPNDGAMTGPGGAWYLCYDQTALPLGMFALNVNKDWSKEPCATCNGYALESYRELTKYLQVSPFAVRRPEDFDAEPGMFDVEGIVYTNTTSYGMNLEISVGCDLTDFIIGQRAMFATALQKQVAISVLRLLVANPDVRVNRNQLNVSRDEIMYDIEGAVQGRPSGLAYELQQAYKALQLDTEGLDRVCLACNTHGVRYGTI